MKLKSVKAAHNCQPTGRFRPNQAAIAIMQVVMEEVTIKKGYRLNIAGHPSKELIPLPDPSKLALCAGHVRFIKPRLKVSEGDRVRIGSVLLEDKRRPEIRFLSPAAGTVSRIQFGPRRVIEAVVIDRDPDEAQVEWPTVDTQTLERMTPGKLVDHVLDGGLWWVFNELPYRLVPHPGTRPPLIMVSLDAKEPFQPSPAVYLADRIDLFRLGIRILNKLADGRVVVSADRRDHAVTDACNDILTHRVCGRYPSDDPATLLYYIKRSEDQNRAWTVSGQDVLLLAQLFAQGRYPVDRIVAVGGSDVMDGRHYRTRIGVPLAHLLTTEPTAGPSRIVVGGLMRGHTAAPDGFLDLQATAVTRVPQGDQARFLSLFNPGLSMPSYSRTFLSRLNPRHMVYDCNLNGGRRACIACMHCADVCPVDILPQMTYKAIMAEEIEEALQHGLLDCVECGLCAYVCPSKIELSQTFKTAKAAYAKEIGKLGAA